MLRNLGFVGAGSCGLRAYAVRGLLRRARLVFLLLGLGCDASNGSASQTGANASPGDAAHDGSAGIKVRVVDSSSAPAVMTAQVPASATVSSPAGHAAQSGGAAGAAVSVPTSAGGGGPAGGVGGGGSVAPEPAVSAPSEWRMMGYDEKNWYFNPQEKALSVENAKQLKEKWRFTISGIPMGSLSVADGKVFAMATGGTYAIDLDTGKQLWARTDIAGNAVPAYSAGFLYVQTSLPPNVYKLRVSDGTTVWGPIRNCNDDSSCSGESSPIVVGDTVYVGMENNMAEASFSAGQADGKRGAVRALDAASGDLLWLYQTIPEPNTLEDGASVWSSISVDVQAGLVFATTGNSYTVAGPNGNAFHAIDLMTGARRWAHQVRQADVFTAAAALSGKDSTKFDFDFGANPILAEVDGQRVVAAGDKGGSFWMLARETGEIIWRRDDLSSSHDATAGGILMNGAFDGRAFFVVSNDPKAGGAVLHRMEAVKGASTWTHEFKEFTWGAPSLANGVLFVPNNASLYVMNAGTGEVLSQFDTGGTMVGGAPAVAQGRVVVKSGFLYTDPNTKLNDQVICYALPEAPGGPTAGGPAPAAGTSAPLPAAGFGAIFQDIIQGKGCNTGQCHSGASAGGLDLTTKDAAYRSLVGVAAMSQVAPGSAAPGCAGSGMLRVAPGEPDQSLLVAKLEHTQTCGAPMPNAGTRLPAVQLQQIRDWILTGAMNAP